MHPQGSSALPAGVEIFPHSDRNAIVSVTFALELAVQMSEAALRAISALHPAVKDFFPRKTELQEQSITLQFGADATMSAVPPAAQANPLSGVTFQQLTNADVVAWAFHAQAQHVLVQCFDYGRWDQVWARALDLFRQLVPPVFSDPEQRIIGVGLQCTDRFLVKGPIEAMSPALVFDKDADFLPRHIFSLGSAAWHCHQGFVRGERSGTPEIHLINVTVASDPSSGQAVEIVGLHRAITALSFASNGGMGFVGPGDDEALPDLMRSLHLQNKEMVAGLLTDALCGRIGLEKS